MKRALCSLLVIVMFGCEGGAAPAAGSTVAESSPSPPTAGCEHPGVAKRCVGGFCQIPAGCFVMGSPEGEPGRGSLNEEATAVTLTRAFEIGEHEVTQGEWTQLGLPNPSGKSANGTGDCLEPQCPVGNVTWYEAVAFANLLSERHTPPLQSCYELSGCTGALGAGMQCDGVKSLATTLYACQGYRLPTFAEWEYAARAGTKTAFYSGEIAKSATIGTCFDEPPLARTAWYCFNAAGSTHPVGQKEPNAWGLHDTLGNAGEWVNDSPFGQSAPGPLTNPGGELVGTAKSRVRRGGLYNAGPVGCRAAARLFAAPTSRAPGLGFRLVRSL